MQRLVLWDIDHTLLYAGGFGPALYAEAFAAVTGRTAASLPRIAGHTDHELVRGMLREHGIEAGEEMVARFYRALEDATYRIQDEIRSRGRLMPGARQAVLALAAVPGTVQSVVTGNLPVTARLKLELFGLADHLDLEVGGFGSDDGVRAALVRRSRERAAAKYGRGLPATRVWVIGDTASDVAGARAAGVRCVGVGTGPGGPADLVASGADLLVADLSDTAALVTALCGPDLAPTA